jgi:hypothetical protein
LIDEALNTFNVPSEMYLFLMVKYSIVDIHLQANHPLRIDKVGFLRNRLSNLPLIVELQFALLSASPILLH